MSKPYNRDKPKPPPNVSKKTIGTRYTWLNLSGKQLLSRLTLFDADSNTIEKKFRISPLRVTKEDESSPGTWHGRAKLKEEKDRGLFCFYQELHVLQLLEKNFINEPKIDHYPFPKVLSYNTVQDSDGKYSIVMNYCGINAIQNAQLVPSQQNIKPNNLYNTVECIINNLRNNLIVYGDWKGDNVCIDKNGNVSLIDFGRYKFKNEKATSKFYTKPDLVQLKKDLYDIVGCELSDHLVYKALGCRDEHGQIKWKKKLFKHNPWSILYLF